MDSIKLPWMTFFIFSYAVSSCGHAVFAIFHIFAANNEIRLRLTHWSFAQAFVASTINGYDKVQVCLLIWQRIINFFYLCIKNKIKFWDQIKLLSINWYQIKKTFLLLGTVQVLRKPLRGRGESAKCLLLTGGWEVRQISGLPTYCATWCDEMYKL